MEGDFVLDIEWFVDGDKIKKGGRFDFLIKGDFVMLKIFEISVEDEGEYKCIVMNENGIVIILVEFIVNGKGDFEKFLFCCCFCLVWLIVKWG